MRTVRTATELVPLRKIVANLQGQICAGPQLAYGNAVFLSFGELLRPATTRLPPRYEWQIGTWGTYWELRKGRVVVSNSHAAERRQEGALLDLCGRAVRWTSIVYPSLTLRVRIDSYEFVVRPGKEGSDPEVPEWDLRTVEGRILTIWPNRKWVYPSKRATKIRPDRK